MSTATIASQATLPTPTSEDFDEYVIVVTGSREWFSWSHINDALIDAATRVPDNCIPVLMHGDASGLDRMAAHVATNFGWKVVAVPADWNRLGNAAGSVRNKKMIDSAPNEVIAFVIDVPTDLRDDYPMNRGTLNCLNMAKKKGIPHTTVTVKFDQSVIDQKRAERKAAQERREADQASATKTLAVANLP